MDFKAAIAQSVAAATGLEAQDVAQMLETPPSADMGDYALPCFKLAKTLRKAPAAIADGIAQQMERPAWLSRVESVKGYLNFFLDRALLVESVLAPVMEQGGRYGSSDMGGGRTVCIDYSSINIAKRFHIGHLPSTVLGHALYRLNNFMGYKSVGINHLGDWGTQFGKMIAAYKRWGSREMVEEGGVDALSSLYVRFHAEAEENKALEDEGRAWFKKIEDNDEEAMSIFSWFKEITLKDAMKTYDLLGISFDSYAGESFYNDKMDRVIDELEAKGLLVESEGAKVVRLDDYQMPPCMILKKDGATLYATRDIAAALYRKDTYDFAKCLYVVAYQQNLHFKQWFKVIELMGYDWYNELEHVAFGMVSFEGQTLSTRKGRVVYLDDLLQGALEKARAIIEEKNPDLPNKDEVARQVGIGAVVFTSLFNNRIKDIDFWWDRALNFDGETGPYVQYTYARCCSLLRKGGYQPGPCDYS
ncbi:MAG: arginine--tRNA ligase, partial [Christensenellaceae bacterium]